MERFPFAGEVVWHPTPEIVAQSNLQRFMVRHGLRTLNDLQRRSTADIEWFWDAVLRELDIRFYEPFLRILDLSRGVEWPQWCVGGSLNIVHNCLDKYAGTPTDDKIALRWEGERGGEPIRVLTYAELRREVNKAANYLRSFGLGKGDAVGVFMPMTPECVVAMLSVIKIGGIFLPLFSGFGAPAVAARLAGANAKALIASEQFQRRGRILPMKRIAEEAAGQVESAPRVIMPDWESQKDEAETARTLAEDIMMNIYTSGTTGLPKGAAHTHCGFPVKAAQDMWMGLDLHADETLFWVTDMGWMMGPWQVFGTLLLGATMLIYDGAPDYPPDRLWSLVERHKVTTLGISPTLARTLARDGDRMVRAHDLTSLRKFGSTGEPWNPDSWLWLFNVAGGGKLPIINYSGGTEISGGIVMGNVLTPLKPCAFSGPAPGMAADVVDEEGRSVRGEVGELVIRRPWIGMTRGFWNDPQRYLDTYWSRFPGVWAHGDWAAVDDDGMWYILGRSDDTIKIAGKRLGPSEVESLLVTHPSVGEAAAIGVPDEIKTEALVCFCVLKPGYAPNDALRGELKALVIDALGKPFAPREVKFVRALPKTRNAKTVRRVIRATYLGNDPGDLSAIENSNAIEDIRNAT